MNIDNFTDHRCQTRPLGNSDGLMQNQEPSVITSEHRQNMDIVQSRAKPCCLPPRHFLLLLSGAPACIGPCCLGLDLPQPCRFLLRETPVTFSILLVQKLGWGAEERRGGSCCSRLPPSTPPHCLSTPRLPCHAHTDTHTDPHTRHAQPPNPTLVSPAQTQTAMQA